MPIFVQTGGSKSNTIIRNRNNTGFTTILRAKNKQTRIRIAAIAEAAYKCGGMHYTKDGRMGLYKALQKGGNYAARLKIAKTKTKGKGVDCSGFSCACTYGAGDPLGSTRWAPNSGALVRGEFANYTKHSYKNQVDGHKYQRGDIVCYPPPKKGADGHVAVIVNSGSAIDEDKYFWKNYCKDGSKIIKDKKTNKIITDYCQHWKKKGVNRHDDSKSQLKAYIDDLYKQRRTIKNKLKNQKRKEKTKARKAYIRKLEKAKDALDDAIEYAEKKLKKMKNKKTTNKNKNRPKGKTQNATPDKGTTPDEGTTPDDKGNPDEGTGKNTNENMIEDKEPEPEPEKVDYYFIRSGPNYFSQGENNVLHKDYLGKTYCKRKLKIKTLVTTDSLWDFTFDMPFSSCSYKTANITTVNKIADDHWQVFFAKNAQGQIAAEGTYTFKLKTSLDIEYEITCDIETHYDD